MIFQLVITSERQDSGGAKGLSVKSAPSEVVQLLSHLGIGVVLKQLIDEHQELGGWRRPWLTATVIVSVAPPLKRT